MAAATAHPMVEAATPLPAASPPSRQVTRVTCKSHRRKRSKRTSARQQIHHQAWWATQLSTDAARVPTPSIPSKFDTILIPTRGEANAFGRRTERFDRRVSEQAPGPGTYHTPRSLVHEDASVSHKGSLSFASASGRFARGGVHANTTPGPGSYEAERRRSPRSTTSRLFAKPAVARSLTKEQSPSNSLFEPCGMPTPGPGAYNPDIAHASRLLRNWSKGQSPFMSKIERSTLDRTQLGLPAPGAYDVARAHDWLHQRGKKHASTLSFVSTVERTSGFERPSLVDARAHPGHGPPTALPDLSNLLDDLKRGRHRRNKTTRALRRLNSPWSASHRRVATPGPGDYDSAFAYHASKLDLITLNHSSSMFSNDQLDRWGRPRQPRTTSCSTPGPGWYEPQELASPVSPHYPEEGFSSSFASTTRRFEREPRRDFHVPGPAFYEPRHLSRKNFHHNSQDRWV